MLYKRVNQIQVYIISKMQVQKMSQRYHFFLDVSGSVGDSPNYWNTVSQILTLYGPEIESFYFWDTQLELVDKKKLQNAIRDQMGRGGTSPDLVARECVRANLKQIILITDGQVMDRDVQSCDQILKDHQFTKTICYIISSGYGDIDMSVTCPFTRNCENKVFKKESHSPLEAMAQFAKEDFKVLDSLDTITLENFTAEYDKIEGLIIALNMGKDGNIPLKNNLVIMKNRLINELAKQKGGEKKDLSSVVRGFLEKNDFLSAMTQIQQASEKYMADNSTVDLENKIAHLISLCGDLRGKYDLNQIKSNKMAIAKDAQEGEIDKEVEIMDLSKNPIECPILNDEDVPQILIDECEPLLLNVDKSIVDDIVACPLRILNYPTLKAKLKARLSNYVGVMGIKAKFDTQLLKNPFTQNRLLGSIPLGTHKSHVKVGNYTLAKLISGGKLLGNMNMYYAVVWYLIQEKSIEYLKDIEKNATEHLIYRLKSSKTYASMCGKSQFMTTQVSTDIAVWYCVNSGFLNLPTNRDTFRFHLYDLQPMMKIVEALGYPNDKGLIGHYHRTNAFFNLMSIRKTVKSANDQKSFGNLLKGLYQNGVFINTKQLSEKLLKNEVCPTFIPVDGPASVEQITKIRALLGEKYKFTVQLSNEELVYLESLIDTNKQVSEIALDYNLVVPELPQAEVNWKYGLIDGEKEVKICPKTLRPFSKEEQEKQVKPVGDLNEYKYFEAFVFKYEKLPTVDELIVFLYDRFVEGKKFVTLPFQVEKWANRLIEDYKPHFQTLGLKKVKKIFNEYRAVNKRIKVEAEN